MKRLSMMVLAGSVVLLTGSTASAQSRTLQGEHIAVSVTIEAIDQSSRTLTVKNDKGIYETMVVPADVKRFSELKVGDRITARYYDNVVVRLKRAGESPVDIDSAALTRNDGSRPGGTLASQRTVTVAVTAMDPATMSVTVKGPNGYVYTRRVADQKAFSAVKVGDQLDMTWTEALLISVDPAKK